MITFLRKCASTLLVKFAICHFLVSPGPFEILAKMGTFTKSKRSRKWCAHFCSFKFDIRLKDEWATWWDHSWWGAILLRGCYGPSKRTLWFLTHFRHFKGHMTLTYFIKNQSIGVAKGALHTLVWIFECVTDWLFGGPLSANFWDVKKFYKFSHDGYWTFWSINSHECVNICEFMEHFFWGSSVWAMAIWVFSPK